MANMNRMTRPRVESSRKFVRKIQSIFIQFIFFSVVHRIFWIEQEKKTANLFFFVQVEFLECLSCYYQSLAENLNTFHTSGDFLFINKYYAWNSVDNARAPLSRLFQFSIFLIFRAYFSVLFRVVFVKCIVLSQMSQLATLILYACMLKLIFLTETQQHRMDQTVE